MTGLQYNTYSVVLSGQRADFYQTITGKPLLRMNIFEHTYPKEFSKGTILLQPGDVSLFAYKVIKGCLKSYVVDKSGKEYILQFAPEGWLISDMDSFVNNRPSFLFIDAIEDAEVLLFDRKMLSILESQSKEELLAQTNVLTKNIIAINKRLTLLLSSTAEERYLAFLQTYPSLVQRLPLKLIASYIGITPEYLSEIRRKLARK